MNLRKENGYYLENLKALTIGVLQRNTELITPLCSKELYWKINEKHGNLLQLENLLGIISGEQMHVSKKLFVKNVDIVEMTEQIVQTSGEIIVQYDANPIRLVDEIRILLTFVENKIAYIYMTYQENSKRATHRIKATNEDFHVIEESEILYIEANHNQVIWHCISEIIISNDSLQHLEQEMSKDFIRIQRGYLINRNYVKCVRRCEAVMNNGDILPIPSKKYVSVKKKIME